jgi:hypothetical protein
MNNMNCHSELDESSQLVDFAGSVNWAIALGRHDIQHAVVSSACSMLFPTPSGKSPVPLPPAYASLWSPAPSSAAYASHPLLSPSASLSSPYAPLGGYSSTSSLMHLAADAVAAGEEYFEGWVSAGVEEINEGIQDQLFWMVNLPTSMTRPTEEGLFR